MKPFSTSRLMKFCYLIQALAAMQNPVAQAFLSTLPVVHPASTTSSSIASLDTSTTDTRTSIPENQPSYLQQQAQQLGEAARRLLHSSEEDDNDTLNMSNEYSSSIANVYEDVGVIFQSAAAHGDGSLPLSTLEDHLKMRADSAVSISVITSIVEILHNSVNVRSHENNALSVEDAANAFAQYIASQQTLLG